MKYHGHTWRSYWYYTLCSTDVLHSIDGGSFLSTVAISSNWWILGQIRYIRILGLPLLSLNDPNQMPEALSLSLFL